LTERWLKILLSLTGLIMFVLFFLIKDLSGDISDIFWRFALTKTHLASEFTMPYFTPARCGGFLLAADAQDLIFTFYSFISFLIPNIFWAIKLTTFFLSIIFTAGMYFWLPYFRITHSITRLFTALLMSVSGYWVMNITQGGHLWVHGLVYTPWIMILIEDLLAMPPLRERRYILRILALSGLFFLLINSGYYWLQITVPLIGFRCLTELMLAQKPIIIKQIKKLGIIAMTGLFAILLSWPRLGGIQAFQLSKFPRLGGEISHSGIIENTRLWLELLWKSFFDGNTIIHAIHSPKHLGFMWDYNNFIGLTALIPLLIGLFKIKTLFKSRAFIALFLAGLFQLTMTRTPYAANFLRFLLPIYKQVAWYWRGSAILVFDF